jgi:organic radical activating enzyme
VIEVLQTGLKMSGGELTEQQRLSAQHITFSLTEACPLQCRHCIVNTVSAADKTRTMPLERAQLYARQLTGLKEQGVRLVSFTGGEPLLASRQLRLLSDSAGAEGMECTVVTACHWAGSEAAADGTLANFPAIANWQLSMDVFHEEFIPWDNVIRAARAALIHGRRPLIRMAASVPLTEGHLDLYRRIQSGLPEAVRIVVQPVTLNGRGKSVETELTSAPAQAPAWPCIPNGMVVRFDGTLAPCCGGLADQRSGHPFQYGNADATGLLNAHMQWCADPLLQLIRTAGFGPVLAWVREISPEHELLHAIPEHPCECCLGLWRDPALGPEIRRRAELPQNRNKIAALTQIVFGETFMKQACTEPSGQSLNP